MLPDLTRPRPRGDTAIEAEDRSWTYGELDDLANRYLDRSVENDRMVVLRQQ